MKAKEASVVFLGQYLKELILTPVFYNLQSTFILVFLFNYDNHIINNIINTILLWTSPFYKWGNWRSEKLSNLIFEEVNRKANDSHFSGFYLVFLLGTLVVIWNHILDFQYDKNHLNFIF